MRALAPLCASSRASSRDARVVDRVFRSRRNARANALGEHNSALDRYAPPHRQNSPTTTGPTTTTGSGTTTNGSVNATDPLVAQARETLAMSEVGDLLMVTAESANGNERWGRRGDGAGDEGDDGAHAEVVRWFVVRRIGMSTGGRKMIEGEMEGKRAQILDQGGTNPARVGVAGALTREDGRLMRGESEEDGETLKRAAKTFARKIEIEDDALTVVKRVRRALTLEMLETAVTNNPDFWTKGEGPHTRRVVKDPTELAVKTTGELLALKHRHRDVVLVQIVSDWPCGMEDSLRAPYAATLLEDMLENDDSLSIAVSEASYRDGEDKDGEPTYARGVTAIVYRDVAKHKAELLKSIGAQATKTISGAFEQALVGVALGYSDENVAHYVRKMNEEDQLSDEDVLNLIETAKNEVEALCSS